MSHNETLLFETLKVLASFSMPVIALIFGLIINKKLEINKKALLQEKEWQVSWAETFLAKAVEFEETISLLLAKLHVQNQFMTVLKDGEAKHRQDDLAKFIYDSFVTITYLEWDIRNFSQFAEMNGAKLIEKQSELIKAVFELFGTKSGDAERIRSIQQEYNRLVRQAHNEILTKGR